MRTQLKSGFSRQMDVDAAGPGLQFPSRCLLAFDLNSAASGVHANTAVQARCVNRSAARGCLEVAFDIAQRDAARTGVDFNSAGYSLNRLATRAAVGAHVRFGRHDDFIADRNIALQIAVGDSSDADRLTGLLNGRIRFKAADGILSIAIRPKPVVAGAN